MAKLGTLPELDGLRPISKPSLYAIIKQYPDHTPGSVTKRPISHVGATERIDRGSRHSLAGQLSCTQYFHVRNIPKT
jgi:hypothetical protein